MVFELALHPDDNVSSSLLNMYIGKDAESRLNERFKKGKLTVADKIFAYTGNIANDILARLNVVLVDVYDTDKGGSIDANPLLIMPKFVTAWRLLFTYQFIFYNVFNHKQIDYKALNKMAETSVPRQKTTKERTAIRKWNQKSVSKQLDKKVKEFEEKLMAEIPIEHAKNHGLITQILLEDFTSPKTINVKEREMPTNEDEMNQQLIRKFLDHSADKRNIVVYLLIILISSKV